MSESGLEGPLGLLPEGSWGRPTVHFALNVDEASVGKAGCGGWRDRVRPKGREDRAVVSEEAVGELRPSVPCVLSERDTAVLSERDVGSTRR